MFGDPITNPMGWETETLAKVAPVVGYTGKMDNKVWLLNLDMVESQTGEIIDYLIVDKSTIGASTCNLHRYVRDINFTRHQLWKQRIAKLRQTARLN